MLETIRGSPSSSSRPAAKRIAPVRRTPTFLGPCRSRCRRPAGTGPAGVARSPRVDLDNLRAALSWSLGARRATRARTGFTLRRGAGAILVLAEPVCRGSALDRSGLSPRARGSGRLCARQRCSRPPCSTTTSATTRRPTPRWDSLAMARASGAATEGHARFALSLVAGRRGEHRAAASHARWRWRSFASSTMPCGRGWR